MDTIIFCDGASKGNPGPGGWGAVLSGNNQVFEIGGSQQNVTNNKMELTAAVQALNFAKQKNLKNLQVYCDSSYVINGITKWIFGWKKKGWTTQDKKPVSNKDLWLELDSLANFFDKEISWHNVGGHIGIAGNERADSIASGFALGEVVQLYSGGFSDYKIDITSLKSSSVKSEIKHASRAHAKAAAYSYVSEVDGEIKIHKTWAECEARVKGKKARFKKAVSAAQEREIVSEFRK